MSDRLLSVDCGTQSLRVMVFDPDGSVLAKAKTEYAPYASSLPGWAEQDPLIFWESLVAGCRRIAAAHPGVLETVAGVGVTAQRDTMICLDKDGVPLRPAITWLDTRKARNEYHPGILHRIAYRIAGMSEPIRTIEADGKLNWIRQNEPRVWEQTWKYVQVSGYLNYKLTGEVIDSASSMVGHIPMDYKRFRWAGPRDLKSKIFPLEDDKKYPLGAPATTAGYLSTEAARQTGLQEGVPVVLCASDKACEALGVGAIRPELASASFGTTATISVTTPTYFEPVTHLPPYCAAYPGSYNPEIEIYRGYWMLSWFRDELGYQEREEARRTGRLPEPLVIDLMDASPPGNNGLLLQPFWGPGIKHPHARGVVIGFADVHTRSSILRAIVEGLGYALREGLEQLERRGHFRSPRVAVAGGASQSDRIMQTTANIFNRPLLRSSTYETASLGAAMLTAVGVGIHSSVDAAVEQMVSYEHRFEPEPAHRTLYDDLYQIYRRLFRRLEPVYHDLRRVTGYPE